MPEFQAAKDPAPAARPKLEGTTHEVRAFGWSAYAERVNAASPMLGFAQCC